MEEIKRLKATLADIIDSLPSIILVVDREGRVNLWNGKAEKFSGIPSIDACGRLAEALLPQFSPHLRHVPEVIDREQTTWHEKSLLYLGNDRRFYDVQICAMLSEGAGRAVVRIDDVTEQARIEEIMIQTEKMAMVGGLAAGMAHEINNPLGAIMQQAQNIERRISPTLPANLEAARQVGVSLDAVRAYLEKRGITGFISQIREAGSRTSRIITNMLHFSRKSDVLTESIDLAAIVDQTLELAANDYDLKKSYDFRHIEIVREYHPDMPSVVVAVLEIKQVVLNIIKNAAQAMAEYGPEEPRITVRLRREAESAVIEIEDNGPGMEKAIQHRIFEPFFTTKPVGAGTGLGLSVSYAIITNRHKGQIEVCSHPGRGSRFTVKLPISRKMAC
ncbi:hypothetical protein GSbR_02840 [Geobacter sp. SVR]|nr:hypothetical protein GSVR_39880 [Geobacter sp. SVR]GCF83684.1 hypothetical protein GSbR_02840 [Geobacter sp. SVR]